VDPLQRRALTNGGIAALLTMLVGFGIVAAVSGGERAATPPSPGPGSPSPTPPTCAPSWETVPTQDPSEGSNALHDVVALSATEGWAVGATGLDPVSPTTALVQRWDGVAWTAVEAPSPGSEHNELLAVDDAGPNEVWAVGRTASGFGDRPLALRFEGTEWTQVDLPSEVTGVLTGVAAISPSDVWVVGFAGDPAALLERALLLHWDGVLWENVEPGRAVGGGRSLLRDVEALAATDVWATGYRQNRPLFIRFDGEAWNRSETEVRGVSNAIEPVSPTEAWAVGSPIQWFDGLEWVHAAELPRAGELHGVGAVAPDDVWAVGLRLAADEVSTRSLVLRWDGGRWRVVDGPGVPGSDALMGIDALQDGTVLAVGYRDVSAGRRTLAIRGTTCPGVG
jgi:hypothetical protein